MTDDLRRALEAILAELKSMRFIIRPHPINSHVDMAAIHRTIGLRKSGQ